MMNAKEFWISKFPDAEKDWGKAGHDDRFQVRMMEEYAKYYHEQQVNSVDLANVVGQSEQLFCHHEGRYSLKSDGNCCKCHLPPKPTAK